MKSIFHHKTIRTLGAVCAIIVVAAGCARPEGEEQVTLEVLIQPNDFSEAHAAAFMEENPDIELIVQGFDWENLATRLTSGQAPDLSGFFSSRVPQYVNNGWLEPLDEWIDSSEVINWDDLQIVSDAWRYDPQTREHLTGPKYGMTKDWNITSAYFYRRDLFEEAGLPLPEPTETITYQEFYDNYVSQIGVREDGVTTRWALDGALVRTAEVSIRNMLATAGTDIYNEDLSEINLVDNPEAMEALRFIADLPKDRYFPSVIDPAPNWGAPLLANLEESPLGIYQYGYWAVASIVAINPEAADQIGYAIGPAWSTDVDVQQLPLIVGFTMFADSPDEEKEAAWRLMEELVAGSVGIERARSGWGIPALRSMFDLLPEENSLARQVKEVTAWQIENQNLVNEQVNPYASDPFSIAFEQHLPAYLQDDVTFEEFAQILEDEANALIADQRN